MTKLSRRDYLIRMSATASVLAASKLDLLARDVMETASRVGSMVQNGIYVPSGPNMYDLLPTESVKLVFHGLMGILPLSANGCKVGFHSKPTDKHRHRLKVMAFTNCVPKWSRPKEVPVGAKPELKVIEPSELINGVKYYQPPLNPLHRNDFRHVMDLEGAKWYRQRLNWRSDGYKPGLIIENGLFYTLLRTGSTFKKQIAGTSPTSAGDPIGSVASYVGVNIYLKPRGRVTLKIPQAQIDLSLEQAAGRHEIHFENTCSKRLLGTDCVFRYGHADETERNDFYMHSEAVESIIGDKYQLVRVDGPSTPPFPDICSHHRSTRENQQSLEKKMMMTDEAPCAALGYGYAGWPAYP